MVGYLVGESVYYSLFPMHDMTFDILGGATLLIMLLAAYFGGLSADIAYDAVAERSLLVRIPVPGLTAGLITFFPPTVFATLFYVPLSFKPWDNFMEFFPLFLSLGGGAFLGGALYAVLRAYKEWSFK